ncbi:MAG: hypothetical protein ACJ8F7_18220 [Gemmataceae bacterium]
MRTWFQRAGVERILAGAGILVFSAALGGCLSSGDKNKARPTTPTQNSAASNGTNGQQQAGQRINATSSQFPNQNQTQPTNQNSTGTQGLGNQNSGLNNPGATGANRTTGTVNDGSSRFNMTSGAMGPTNTAAGGPRPFDQGTMNANGTGNPTGPGQVIASNSNSGNIRPVSGNGSPVSLNGIQPDPTPGMQNSPRPVVVDPPLRPAFPRTPPPSMDGGDSGSGILPVQPGSRQ